MLSGFCIIVSNSKDDVSACITIRYFSQKFSFVWENYSERLGVILRKARSDSPNVAEYYSKRHVVTLRNTRSITPKGRERYSEKPNVWSCKYSLE